MVFVTSGRVCRGGPASRRRRRPCGDEGTDSSGGFPSAEPGGSRHRAGGQPYNTRSASASLDRHDYADLTMREAVDTLCRGGPLPVGMAEIYKISAHAAAMVSCVAPSGAFVPDLGEAVRSRTVAVSVAILSGLMLSGCSGDSNWGDKDSDSPSPARKGLAALEKPAEGPTPDGVQDNTTKDSKTLATEAVAVMADAPALKVAAAGTGEDGQAIRTEGCVRTTDKALRVVSEQSGGVFEVIHFDGYQYMQGDTRAWLALTGLHSAEAKAVFDKTLAGNRWVKSKLSSDDVWSLPSPAWPMPSPRASRQHSTASRPSPCSGPRRTARW